MTNHEGQPRPPSQPTNFGDTLATSTPTKVRKRQQGNPTCKPSRQHRNWNTLTKGAKPNYPSKQAEQEKPRKSQWYLQQGKQHTLQVLRKRTQQDPSNPTLGVDQQAGDRHANPPGKGAEPRRGRIRHSTTATERKTPKHKNRDHQRRRPAAKNPQG